VIDILIDIILLSFLAIIAIAIIRTRSLLAVIMLFSIFSLLSAGLFMVLDASDVAFTEAAVGAGISTVLMLATLALTKSYEEKPSSHRPWIPLLVVSVTAAFLVYGTIDMPPFGDPNAPAHQHVAPRYIEQGAKETGVPNLVTAVLASYRGFDTLGEVTVIFTAGIGVLLLLGGRQRHKNKKKKGRR
jgi:multicomponent Na+:H+ antiporter subunit B